MKRKIKFDIDLKFERIDKLRFNFSSNGYTFKTGCEM